jgi:hypothetical protein
MRAGAYLFSAHISFVHSPSVEGVMNGIFTITKSEVAGAGVGVLWKA